MKSILEKLDEMAKVRDAAEEEKEMICPLCQIIHESATVGGVSIVGCPQMNGTQYDLIFNTHKIRPQTDQVDPIAIFYRFEEKLDRIIELLEAKK